MSNEDIVKTDLQKEIIDKVIADLFKEDPSLYYSATMEIAAIIISKVETPGYLSYKEREIMENLTSHDIQHLISYASNCC